MKKLLPLMVLLSLALVVPALADDGLQSIPDPLSVSINVSGSPGTQGHVAINGGITFTGTETITNTYTNALTNNDTNNCTTTITKDVLDECTKDITYIYTTDISINSEADACVYKCEVNHCNTVDTFCVQNNDLIKESFTNFNGIAQVNQASGSMNNQGNIVGAAAVDGSAPKLSSGAQIQMANFGNSYDCPVKYTAGLDCFDTYCDKIDCSFTQFNGLAQVNQAAGYMNNQNNAVSLAADPNAGIVACADSQLSMCNAKNCGCFAFDQVTNTIKGSFTNFNGVAQVNQSAGSMNNQANVIAVSAGLNVNAITGGTKAF